MPVIVKKNFGAGVIDPGLEARPDAAVNQSGLRAATNVYVKKITGLAGRPGSTYVTEAKDSTNPIRLVEFDFGGGQGQPLEFGDGYVRFSREGLVVTETPKAIESVTLADPGVFTITGHGYETGDEILPADIEGMVELPIRRYRVTRIDADTFSLYTPDGEELDTSAFTALTAGTMAKTHEVKSPFILGHLPYLNYAQSFDLLKVGVNSPDWVNIPIQDLTRLAENQWTMADASLIPSISAPTGLAVSGSGTGTFWAVVAVKKETYELSYAATIEKGAPTSGSPRSVTWNTQDDAVEYNVYRRNPQGVYGLIGIAKDTGTSTVTFVDNNITPIDTITPPLARVSVDGIGMALEQQLTATFPVTALAGTGRCSTWAPQGDLVVTGHDSADYVRATWFNATTGTYTTLASTAFSALPEGPVYAAAFSPSGDYLALGIQHATAGKRLKVYRRTGLSFVEVTTGSNPGTYPTGNVNALVWTLDEKYLWAGHATSPYVSIYLRSGDTFTKQTNPATLPTAQVNALATSYYSSSGNHYVYVGHNYSSRQFTFYRITPTGIISAFTNGNVTTALGTDHCLALAWNESARWLSMGASGGDYLYTFSADLAVVNFKLLPDPDVKLDGAVNGLAWRPGDKNLAAATSGSEKLMAYSRNGTNLIQADVIDTDLAGNGTAVAWAPDGLKLTASHATTPYAALYLVSDIQPGVVGFYQQRFMMASTRLAPDRIWGSAQGQLTNFNQKKPVTDGDSVSFAISGRKLNAVMHLVELRKLVVLTANGEYYIKGDSQGALTPYGINPEQQSYIGSSYIRPVVVNDNLVYVGPNRDSVMNLRYNLDTDGYQGREISWASRHLFRNRKIVAMAYQAIPDSLIWVVFDDGKAASCTFFPEQDVVGWAEHETDGDFEDVCCVREGTKDVVYFAIRRTIDQRDARYIERLADRLEAEQELQVFVDCAKVTDQWNTDENLKVSIQTVTVGPDSFIEMSSDFPLFSQADEDDQNVYFAVPNGVVVALKVDTYNSPTSVYGTLLQNPGGYTDSITTSEWARAISQVENLWHLEGKQVAIVADGRVVSSPNNPGFKNSNKQAVSAVTVTEGVATLPAAVGEWIGYAARLVIGLPYVSSIRTLPIETPNEESMIEKKKNIARVTARVSRTKGLWVGPTPPTSSQAKTEGLVRLEKEGSPRHDVLGSELVELSTGLQTAVLNSKWDEDGSVYVAQLDPVALEIEALHLAVEA